jgi:hypothetical protein
MLAISRYLVPLLLVFTHKALAVVVVMAVLLQGLFLWEAVADLGVMAQLYMRRTVGRFIQGALRPIQAVLALIKRLHQARMVVHSVSSLNRLAAAAALVAWVFLPHLLLLSA